MKENTMETQERIIKSVMSDLEDKIKQSTDSIKTAACDVDKKVRDNPWPVVAGVAVGCVLLGFLAGVTKRN
jgi:ElaB/YqjD/DUF883 family membrane-anchored ribosome-binding protein